MVKTMEAFGMHPDDAEAWAGVLTAVALELYGMKKMTPKEKVNVYDRAKSIIDDLPPEQATSVAQRIKAEIGDARGPEMQTRARSVMEMIRQDLLPEKKASFKIGEPIPEAPVGKTLAEAVKEFDAKKAPEAPTLGAAVKEFRATSEPPSAVKKAITE